jgi:hypothetical protein
MAEAISAHHRRRQDHRTSALSLPASIMRKKSDNILYGKWLKGWQARKSGAMRLRFLSERKRPYSMFVQQPDTATEPEYKYITAEDFAAYER